MSLDKVLRRILERSTNLHIPQSFGVSMDNLAPGSVLDIRDDDRPTLGALHRPPFGLPVPELLATPPLDVGLSITRTLNASASAKHKVAGGEASATFELKTGREVCVLLDPAEGSELANLLLVAEQLRRSPAWDHSRFGLVTRVFLAKNTHVWIAREGGGSLTVQGSTQDVTRALSGQISAGLTWSSKNLFEKAFEGPGVFGVHLARIPKQGPVKVL